MNNFHSDIPDEAILLVPDVAQILKCSPEYVRRLIKEEKLHAYKVGKTYRIPRENLITYINSFIPDASNHLENINALFNTPSIKH